MAESKKIYTSQQYYANFEGDAGNTPADFKGLGYYSRTSLEDIINNFIVAYIGEDKALAKVPRYEVDFWAQRGMQEFSYDILHSEKSVEIELGPTLQFPLPQDYVNYVKVSQVGDDGKKIILLPSRKVDNPTAPLQDEDYDFLYDADGEVQVAAKSTAITRFQDPNNPANKTRSLEDNYNYDDEHFPYLTKRYGSNPEDMSAAGTFFIDTEAGIIFFDSTFSGKSNNFMILDYISDGIADNGDLSKVYVPKLAEDALYAYMLYNLSKLRPSTVQLAPLYKKEASSKMRNAKIRLSNYKLEEMAQVLRGKAKWIKH